MNKCPYSNRSPTTRETLSWPQPSDKVVKKLTDIRHIDAIFLLYQASVKSNSEMIFCLGITRENTKFLDLENKNALHDSGNPVSTLRCLATLFIASFSSSSLMASIVSCMLRCPYVSRYVKENKMNSLLKYVSCIICCTVNQRVPYSVILCRIMSFMYASEVVFRPRIRVL